MTAPNQEHDNPWVIAGLIVLGVVAAVFGCAGWMNILDGPAW